MTKEWKPEPTEETLPLWKDHPYIAGLRAELEQARRELAALREAARWIPVTERFPEEFEEILMVEVSQTLVRYIHKGIYWQDNGIDLWGSGEDRYHNVTHWRPLPPAPEVEK